MLTASVRLQQPLRIRTVTTTKTTAVLVEDPNSHIRWEDANSIGKASAIKKMEGVKELPKNKTTKSHTRGELGYGTLVSTQDTVLQETNSKEKGSLYPSTKSK